MSGWDEERREDLAQRIRVEPDGTVVALSGKIDFGQGIRTAFAQIVADEIDVPIEHVRVVLGDTFSAVAQGLRRLLAAAKLSEIRRKAQLVVLR